MDKLCQYSRSTIIFATNVTILLVVSVVTDYWEYRSFQRQSIIPVSRKSDRSKIFMPVDTNSYFILRYFWIGEEGDRINLRSLDNHSEYEPPALLHRYHLARNISVPSVVWNGTDNVTELFTLLETVKYEDVIVFYTQHGNLFRDCDDVEEAVREQLNIPIPNGERCFNFITNVRESGYIVRELPAVIHLERAAFTFAVICLIASVVSLIAGSYGSLFQEKTSILTASSSAIISAMSLTVTIALFHGKCHLLHRREFMGGMEVPFKRTVNDSRIYSFGWSFILAWICVVLCFIQSWVWLRKAQTIPIHLRFKSRRKLGLEYNYTNDLKTITRS